MFHNLSSSFQQVTLKVFITFRVLSSLFNMFRKLVESKVKTHVELVS